MFISNIISKLWVIIYKLGIIYKATIAPTNKDRQPHSNYYKYMFHRILLHDNHIWLVHTLNTTTSMCPSFFRSYELHYSIYLFFFPNWSYSYLSVRVFCFVGPPSYQIYLSKPTCEVRNPIQPHLSWRVTVPNFGKNNRIYDMITK